MQSPPLVRQTQHQAAAASAKQQAADINNKQQPQSLISTAQGLLHKKGSERPTAVLTRSRLMAETISAWRLRYILRRSTACCCSVIGCMLCWASGRVPESAADSCPSERCRRRRPRTEPCSSSLSSFTSPSSFSPHGCCPLLQSSTTLQEFSNGLSLNAPAGQPECQLPSVGLPKHESFAHPTPAGRRLIDRPHFFYAMGCPVTRSRACAAIRPPCHA